MASTVRPVVGSSTLVWTDIETTGLDPKTGDILEIGVILTDDTLHEIARKKWIVHWADIDTRAQEWPEFVYKMHVKSGLMRDLRAMSSEVGIVTVMEMMFLWIRRNVALIEAGHASPSMKHAMLAGSSVGFDKSWLQDFNPRLLDETHGLHYRVFDVSAIHEAALCWAPDVAANAPEKREIHRVFEDLEDSLTLARYYRDYYGTMR